MRCPPTLTDVPRSHTRSRPQGAVPFFVSATSGTTVLGAFDPLGPVADVCQRHGLWLHVDVSARGGPCCAPPAPLPCTHPALPRRPPGVGAHCFPGSIGSSLPASRGTSKWVQEVLGFWGHRTASLGAPQPSPCCRADSVAWNPHKMLTVGLQCSAFLLRDDSVSPMTAGIPPGPPSDPWDSSGPHWEPPGTFSSPSDPTETPLEPSGTHSELLGMP